VERPGFVSFNENPMTLPDMIASVGGFAKEADPSAMQLRRGDKVYNINYLDAFKSNLPLERMMVQPKDQLFVPALSETQKEQKVYVMGEVGRTGIVNIYSGKLTLAEALASAGGLQALNATSRGIYVIRNTSETKIDVFQLNAKNAMALAMADRFELNARDIVYVDASGLATWNRLISLILPSVQTVYYGALAAHNVHVVKDDYSK
jgi:polysaccharide export outer membrane protein